MPDSMIDYSDIPPLGEDFFKNARLFMPQRKAAVGLRLDADVLDWFKRQGPGYQSRMNAVLKAYKTTQEKRGRQK